MDAKSFLHEVGAWPVEDRLHLIDEMPTLIPQGHDADLTAAQVVELGRRIAEDDERPDAVVSWHEVKSSAWKRLTS
jgi:putative addiction module component (TIGR02574 family)